MNHSEIAQKLRRLKEKFEEEHGRTAFLKLGRNLEVFEGEYTNELSDESMELLIDEMQERLDQD